MQIFESFLNILLQIAVMGFVTLSTAFFVVLNAYKEEIWGVLEFEDERK